MKKEDLVIAVIKETRRIEEDSIYSMKGHFNAGDRWSQIHLFLGLFCTAFATGAGIWRVFFAYPEVITILAFLAAASATVMTFLHTQQIADNHNNAGSKYNILKNRVRRFREIELSRLDDEAIVQKIEELAEKRDELNSTSPSIPRWAYEKAKKDIDDGRHKYLADEKKNNKG